MKVLLTAVIALSLLTGCTTGYEVWASQVTEIEVARAKAEEAQAKALEAIGTNGDASAAVAAAFALSNRAGSAQQPLMLTPPPSMWDRGLQVLSIVAPFAVEGYRSKQNRILGVAQTQASQAGIEAIVNGMATQGSYIQAPAANVSTSTVNTTSTSTTNTSTIRDSYNPITTTTDNTHQPTVVTP